MLNDENVVEPITNTEILGPPKAVVVTRWAGQEAPVKEELEADGWTVEVCAGPGRLVCPLMQGENCDLRSHADAAVVFMSPKEVGSTPRLMCAADPASPGVVALEGCLDSTRFSGSTASVGGMNGPSEIVSAVSTLLVNGWTPGEI